MQAFDSLQLVVDNDPARIMCKARRSVHQAFDLTPVDHSLAVCKSLRDDCLAGFMQVQKLKLDTEAAMLELDQILRANELTVAVVAAIPSLAIAGGTGYLLIRWITPSPPDRKSEALPARCQTPKPTSPSTAHASATDHACPIPRWTYQGDIWENVRLH